MRFLYLGSSIDFKGTSPLDERRAHIDGRRLAEELSEPVEVTVKFIWPNAQLPNLVDGWVDELRPDLVLLHVSAWWCESLVVRHSLAPKLGPLAPVVSRLIRKAAKTDKVAQSGIYRLANRAAFKAVGGKAPFRPTDVVPHVEATLRRLVRHEDLAVCVSATPFTAHATKDPARRAWAGDRRQEVFRLLRPIVAQLHIPAVLPAHNEITFQRRWREADNVHFTIEGHERCSDLEMPVLLKAVRRMREA